MSQYVTPTKRPQWPSEAIRRYVGIALVAWVLPFLLSFGVVYALLRLYFVAGGSW